MSLRNGQFDPYLSVIEKGSFKVIAPTDLDERAFYRQVSQTAAHRGLGAAFEHPLAKKLVQKARDNFVLALELYNRPSLENRLDAFAQLFCTAWEQLLKAELLDEEGEDAVFKPRKEGKRRESISLAACLELKFSDAKNPIRRNLERIAELRHQATHLLMEETASPISRLFQAGVINFASRFRAVTGNALLPESSAGLLSLVGPLGVRQGVDLKRLYGEVTAADLVDYRDEIENEIESVDDVKFAIPVEYKLALVKKESEGDISLTLVAGDGPGVRFVEKAVPVSKKYPFSTTDVVAEVGKRTGQRFTNNDFYAVLLKLKWRNSNNEFHHHEKRVGRPFYSAGCVDEIVKRVKENDLFLDAARKSYRQHLNKQKKGK
ncbi:MAG: DUF3644 domain-containing protein [Deltaproteobacteria bacterium]|nr:DUF3644 domain-containing protein [Deltaproteobacteria bacterium]